MFNEQQNNLRKFKYDNNYVILSIYKNKKKKIYSALKVKNLNSWGFPGGSVVKYLPVNVGDTSSNPDLGRSHMSQSN